MAIYTDSHVITMPHKCGTTYIMRVLSAACGAQKVLEDRHIPMSRIPVEYLDGRRVLGIVRNPFRWYVSRWHYVAKTMNERRPFRDALKEDLYSENGVFGNKPPDVPSPPPVGSFTWQHVMFNSLNYSQFCQTGEITFSVNRMMRLENITEDLVCEFGQSIMRHLNQFRNSYTPNWMKYIDDECVEMIAKADNQVIEHYGYTPT